MPVPHVLDQAFTLFQIGRDSFVLVIGDVAARDHPGLRMLHQPVGHRADRLPRRGMQVHHRMGILAIHVQRRMDRETGGVDRMAGGDDRLPLDIDLHQAGGGDLLEHHVVGIDQEMVFRPRHAGGKVGEDQVVPAIERDEAIGRGEIDPHCPFLVRNLRTNVCVRSGRVVVHHRCHAASPIGCLSPPVA